MRAFALAALAVLVGQAADATDRLYTLPAPLMIDAEAHYSGDVAPPAPRRGLVVHGYYYDAYYGEAWATAELAEQAEQCGDALQLPETTDQPDRADQPVIYDFWLVHAPPEALYIVRHKRLTGLANCVATAGYHLEISRLILAGDRVTEIGFEDGQWGRPQTLPANAGFTYAADRFLKPVKLDALRKRYRTMPTPPHHRKHFGPNVVCFDTSGGMIGSGECRLDEPGRWQGILLNRHTFHTSNHDDGTQVEFIDTDALIDGRLFEWDRAISLMPQ